MAISALWITFGASGAVKFGKIINKHVIDIACVLDLAALVTMIYLASFGGKTDFLIKEICFIA